ncbi:MAG: sugar phosphorylase [Cyanobacteria bacterium P01_D01_bin.105]
MAFDNASSSSQPPQATFTEAQSEYFELRVKPLVSAIYEPVGVDTDKLCDRIHQLMRDTLLKMPLGAESVWLGQHAPNFNSLTNSRWSQDDVLLITYGDSFLNEDQAEPPLSTLDCFLNEHLQDVITGVHILPFFPYSSDDGFAVIDYLQVNPELGSWKDIARIAEKFDLMTDVVMNHISSQSEWFKQFQADEAPGCHYFHAVDPKTDVSGVTRPRSSPLLKPVETPQGTRHVWATFGEDQIDLNFTNPDVLIEFLKIILFYLETGAKYLRLDAIGYLWKTLGTPCIHLRETHLLIRLMREVVAIIKPEAVLITETNVPNRENLSYFGNRNEAHMIYNFSLPPLVVNALLQARSDHLRTWMMSMPPAPAGCAYFNFTASHDGIGMRPTEGLLAEAETETFLQCMQQFGGKISMRSKPDGSESVYEVNVSFFDAMKGTAQGEDEWQIERFICSQAIMMALEGIPAFYIHSLLATSNDHDGVARTGRNRSINRHQWNYAALEEKLSDKNSSQSIALKELSRLIQIRRQQPAFHPNATQYTLQLKSELFGFWRQSVTRDQSVFSIHNLTRHPQQLSMRDVNLTVTDPWFDLISGLKIEEGMTDITLSPYQSVWITNQQETEDALI